jgi:hypothetical protein
MTFQRTKAVVAVLGILTALGSAAGCREKGPAEKAGEKFDEAVDKVQDALDPKGPAEKAGEKIDEALE